MWFYLPNGMQLFIPAIIPSKETLTAWPCLRIMYIVELISIIIMCPGAVLLLISLGSSIRLFHRNLIQVAQVHLIALAIAEISRIPLILYDAGMIQRKEKFDSMLFALFTLRFSSMCALITLIPAVIAERAFASRYVNDYESVNRPWISYLVNGSSLTFGVAYYLVFQLGFYSMLSLIVLTLFIIVLATCVITMVHRKDLTKLRDLSNRTGRSTIYYTLSMKFQLQENVRVTKMLTCTSVGILVWMSFSCLLSGFAFVILGEEKPMSQFLYAVINIYMAISLTVVVWLSLVVTGELRRLLIRLVKYSCCSSQFDTTRLKSTAEINDPRITTEKYFGQLHSAWT